ncbi:sensor histidine kinase [Aureibacter tunicatorum]|uniref:Sensor histidine kinase YesM n=1 Tax=Aureibacter tunicatorum TaxID=866807 RepID=A0AAE4BUA1_9BACT|nr:histidine kinase [Aureibacter tunicatorum]MDR6240507.1 sensor histidine kinase YesM [Aureibacter tunicatorum]BDD06630.1 hypothetical protein AUTU_41130 [Aureibacter tunicatorum]
MKLFKQPFGLKAGLALIIFIWLVMIAMSMGLMVLFGYRSFDNLEFDLTIFIFILTKSVFDAFVLYHVVVFFNKVLPWSKYWALRFVADALFLVILIGLTIFFSNIVMEIDYELAKELRHNISTKHDHKELRFIMPVVMNTLFLCLIELITQFQAQASLRVKIAELEKEKTDTKYSVLKEQLDHHFLFNNLSVLSSLIYEDVEKADHFIQDFAKIYRYVLKINALNLVTVDEELDFIKAYLYLFKSRFESGFEYELKVSEENSKCFIPPLTLQVLVENAVKHNEVSKANPLRLKIYCKDKELWVENNLQLREETTESTKTGLRNLEEKFNLMEAPSPFFGVVGGAFIARIPLINKEHE